MAYGEIRYAEFTDFLDTDWKIQIYKNGYSGTNSSFTTGKSGFSLNYKGEELDDKMKSSELSFSFFSTDSTDDSFITSMSLDAPTDYLVEVYRDTSFTNKIYWRGIMQVANLEIPDEFYPQEYRLKAICGLQLLKATTTFGLTNLVTGNYSSKITLDTTVGGQAITLGSVITSILSTLQSAELYTTSETFVRRRGCWSGVGMDLYPNDTFHEFGYLTNYLYSIDNNGNVKFKKCFDIIEQILDIMNARLYQEDGFWRLEQIGIFNDINNLSTPPRYYRIAKDSDLLGQGDGAGVLTDITAAGSQFVKSSGMLTGFSEVIRRVETKISGVEEFDLDYKVYDLDNLPADPTPIAADFINTNLARTNTNQFVRLDWNYRATNVSATLTGAPQVPYGIRVNAFIKCGNKYLQTDTDPSSSTYGEKIWDTALQPFIDPALLQLNGLSGANLTYFNSDTDYESANPVYFLPWNPPTTNSQYQIPSDDNIEVYFYYRVFSIAAGTNSEVDVTADFGSSDFDVELQPTYPNLYGYQVSIIDENGTGVQDTLFTAINAPSGTEIEGGIVIEEEIKFENAQVLTTAAQLRIKNSSGNWVTQLYDFQNVLQTIGVSEDLTRLRQKEKIAMQPISLDRIKGKIIKRDLTTIGLTNNANTLSLHDPIYIGTTLYLIIGMKFSAIEGEYVVTLQELKYDFTVCNQAADYFELFAEAITEDWTGLPINFFGL